MEIEKILNLLANNELQYKSQNTKSWMTFSVDDFKEHFLLFGYENDFIFRIKP